MTGYKINKGFIVQKLDKITVIFDGERSVLYTFNETASSIFSQLKKGKREKDLIKALTDKYQVSEKKAEKDIKELIEDLQKKKIILKT